MKRNKIIHVVTSDKSIMLMSDQVEFLDDKGLDIAIISSPGENYSKYNKKKYSLKMEREISLFNDVKSLLKMILLLLKIKPIIINYGTPKASLITAIAAFITRVPHRIYTIRGLRLETLNDKKYKLFLLIEKLIFFLSNKYIAISPSLKNKLLELKLGNEQDIKVLGKGSSNGVNPKYFTETDEDIRIKEKLMSTLDLQNKFVYGFVGRINRDKGIDELVKAFCEIDNDKSKLLLIGEIETSNMISRETPHLITGHKNIIHIGHQENLIPYYRLMNVFVFPTHREGFGNVSIEAQASGVPVIASNATGSIDTIKNKLTGELYTVKNYKDLKEKMQNLYLNPKILEYYRLNAQQFVKDNFDKRYIHNEMLNLYLNILNK